MGMLSGQTFKGYEIHESIGQGAFGAVYRAHQTIVDREVAIKVILPQYANQPDFIRRFETEAQLVARLEHLHIVPLYDYWRDPDGAYLVMRYLRGGSLKDWIGRGALDPGETLRLVEQIAQALAVAHRHGVVHRDIKPSNILLDEERNAYLADFGIAKVAGGEPSVEGLRGTLDYISPEQIRSQPVTAQTDVYALGIVLYEMLTGTQPFSASGTPAELLHKHLEVPVPDLQTKRDRLPDAVNAVIQTATAKTPTDRYLDTPKLARALREALAAAELAPAAVEQPLVEPLTDRELDVLRLMAEGLSHGEIAQKLVIALTTVKWYAQEIYGKLGVSSKRQAVAVGQRLGLLEGAAERRDIALPDWMIGHNPYKGLAAFQQADAPDFFGREALVEQLVSRLQDRDDLARFLAVIGPSGSGKSSVVRAGLLPALKRGAVPGSENWFVVDMLPGARPLDELEIRFVQKAIRPVPDLSQLVAPLPHVSNNELGCRDRQIGSQVTLSWRVKMKTNIMFLLCLISLPFSLLLFHLIDSDNHIPSQQGSSDVLRLTFFDVSCTNPCWLGIEVGISDRQFVEAILKAHDISYSPNGPFTYNVSLKGEPSPLWQGVANPAADIHLSGDTVSLVTFAVNLCASTILETYGSPQVVTEGPTLFLLYPDYGLNFLLDTNTQRVDGALLYPLDYIDQTFPPSERQDWTNFADLFSGRCTDGLFQDP
jgi:DNA-binding CsgD family transcriptional regulator/tRNA A-37 threonylcarbamoyl transferase component Bud32